MSFNSLCIVPDSGAGLNIYRIMILDLANGFMDEWLQNFKGKSVVFQYHFRNGKQVVCEIVGKHSCHMNSQSLLVIYFYDLTRESRSKILKNQQGIMIGSINANRYR